MKQAEAVKLEQLLQDFEKINDVIYDIEKDLLQPTLNQREDLSTEQFVRQRLYGLRVELGNIFNYTKFELAKLQEVDNG